MSNANTKLHSSVDELFSIVKVKMKLLIIYEKNAIFNFFLFLQERKPKLHKLREAIDEEKLGEEIME